MITDSSTGAEKEEFLRRINEKSNAFNLALGRFVGIFSMVETNLQTYLWQFAGVPSPTAQAVFSGVRIQGAMQTITRIADAQKWDETKKTELAYAFSQLGMINSLRNDILHYGANFADHSWEEWIVTNKNFVHLPEKIQESRITPQILSDAAFDLIKINFHLLMLTCGQDERPPLEEALNHILKSAWHYKPPVPDRASRKNRKNSRKPSRQPKPSPE